MLNYVHLCSHIGQRVGPPDTILEENYPMKGDEIKKNLLF
jgi:hypothetical protein